MAGLILRRKGEIHELHDIIIFQDRLGVPRFRQRHKLKVNPNLKSNQSESTELD
jgi:hypothetical protein